MKDLAMDGLVRELTSEELVLVAGGSGWSTIRNIAKDVVHVATDTEKGAKVGAQVGTLFGEPETGVAGEGTSATFTHPSDGIRMKPRETVSLGVVLCMPVCRDISPDG